MTNEERKCIRIYIAYKKISMLPKETFSILEYYEGKLALEKAHRMMGGMY